MAKTYLFARTLLTKTILRELSDGEPTYVYRLAKELDLTEQSVSYSFERLSKAGLLEIVPASSLNSVQNAGGRPRQWFRITESGLAFLAEITKRAA